MRFPLPKRVMTYSTPHPTPRPIEFKEGEVVVAGFLSPHGYHQVSTPSTHLLPEDARYAHVLSKYCLRKNLVDRATPDVPIFDFKQCFFVVKLEFQGALVDTFKVRDNGDPEKAYDSLHVFPPVSPGHHKVIVNMADRSCRVRSYSMIIERTYALDTDIGCAEDAEYKRNYLR